MITFANAIRIATHEILKTYPHSLLLGLGVNDPKRVFGTTEGLVEEFGIERIIETPLSENAITGAALGLSMSGKLPILIHQRADFTFVAFEQMINQVAKMRFISGDKLKIPLIIRIIVGRGWGQGPNHAQSNHNILGSIPGLNVVAPSTPQDAHDLLIAAANSDTPTIYFEHRWLHQVETEELQCENVFEKNLSDAVIAKSGIDITMVGWSYGTEEAKVVANLLLKCGVSSEIIDLRNIRATSSRIILESIKKTKRLAIFDIGHKKFGIASEILSDLATQHKSLSHLHHIFSFGQEFSPAPSSPYLSHSHYVDIEHAAMQIAHSLKKQRELQEIIKGLNINRMVNFFDTPQKSFGPF